MEAKISIAEILKDKPEGTKLWTDMFGEVTLYVVTNTCDAFQVKHHNKEPWFDKDGKLYKEGVLCIYPSKSMRDWEKFAWKKGDVLVNSRGLKILFDRWANDNYTSFYAKTINLVEDAFLDTNLHTLASEKEAKSFIKCIEEKLGGKLNLETLEIEKQPEFKDGDILYAEKDESHTDVIFILKTVKGEKRNYACLILHPYMVCNYSGFGFIGNKTLRYATEEEKQQLFDALAKEGKAWDAEKKQIVDLKPKWTPKPFDKIVAFEELGRKEWVCDMFSHYSKDGKGREVIVGIGGLAYNKALPFNEETAKLIGTTNNPNKYDK